MAETPAAITIDQRTITAPGGSRVTVVRFRAAGHLRYHLHVGSEDPPVGSAVLPPKAASVISAAERPSLLAAFNGGFKMSAGAGGFEVGGIVLQALVPGEASLVIDADGRARIGVWGRELPVPGEAVRSVRQNLPPLVDGGVASATAANAYDWGATIGGGYVVARSALGQDAHGDLLYAASMATVPADLAAALLDCRAVRAMELDINPEWVQLAMASTPGGPLVAGVPGQERPADQYLGGWNRDFVAVLGPH